MANYIGCVGEGLRAYSSLLPKYSHTHSKELDTMWEPHEMGLVLRDECN